MNVTDADREKAMRIMAWDPLSYDGFAKVVHDGGHRDDREALETVDAIAEALAAERAATIAWVLDQIGAGATFGSLREDQQ